MTSRQLFFICIHIYAAALLMIEQSRSAGLALMLLFLVMYLTAKKE